MTIQEMHARVKQWLDTTATSRFTVSQIDNAINTVIGNKVDDLFHPLDVKQLENSFQANQRIRDTLYPLIVNADVGAIDNTIILSTVTDYRFCIDLFVFISANRMPVRKTPYTTTPITYEEYQVKLILDPNSRPTLKYPSNIYRMETSQGFDIKFGPVGILSSGNLIYLKNPALVNLTNSVNCNLPKTLHEEICKMASEVLKMSTPDLAKQKQ